MPEMACPGTPHIIQKRPGVLARNWKAGLLWAGNPALLFEKEGGGLEEDRAVVHQEQCDWPRRCPESVRGMSRL